MIRVNDQGQCATITSPISELPSVGVGLVATVGSVRHRAPKLGFDIREPRHTLTGACLHTTRDVGEGWYGEAETYLCLDWVLLLLIECASNLVEMNEKWKDQHSLLASSCFAKQFVHQNNKSPKRSGCLEYVLGSSLGSHPYADIPATTDDGHEPLGMY